MRQELTLKTKQRIIDLLALKADFLSPNEREVISRNLLLGEDINEIKKDIGGAFNHRYRALNKLKNFFQMKYEDKSDGGWEK